jgi:hypothetical protein
VEDASDRLHTRPLRANVRRSQACAALATWALAACWPSALCAQAGAATTSEAQAQYAELVSEAVREYNSGAWSEARASFERAHALAPSARTLRGLGLTAFELRRHVDAVAELEAALADPRQPLSPEQRAEASAVLARARRYVGSVRLDVVPKQATVSIDGRVAPQRELVLNVGTYRVGAKAPGYEHAATSLSVEGGQSKLVRLELTPLATAGERDSDPGATQRLLGWSAVGAGGAALAVGVVFELQRASALRERDAICPSSVDCEPGSQRRVDRLSDQARTAATVEVVGLVAGAALVAGGVALLLTASESEAANSRSPGARLGMHWSGASLVVGM